MSSLEKDQLKAEILSEFVDKLNAGFYVDDNDVQTENKEMLQYLRTLLEALAPLRDLRHQSLLSTEEKETLFMTILNRLKSVESLEKRIVRRDIKVDQRPDILILLLYLAKQIWGSTKLVKLLFLADKEGGCGKFVPDYYSHYAYNYGAFDKQVPRDVDALSQLKIISKQTPPRREGFDSNKKSVDFVFELTPQGEEIGRKMYAWAKTNKPDVIAGVQKIISTYGNMNAGQLLSYTYKKYPETAENSKVRDIYLGNEPTDQEDGQ